MKKHDKVLIIIAIVIVALIATTLILRQNQQRKQEIAVNDIFITAYNHYKQNLYELAASECETAIGLDSTKWYQYYLRALSLYKTEDCLFAYFDFDKAIKLNKNKENIDLSNLRTSNNVSLVKDSIPDSLRYNALLYWAARNIAEAENCVEYNNALAYAQESYSLDTGNTATIALISYLYCLQEDYPNAMKWADEMMSDTNRYFSMKAWICADMEQYDKALEYYERDIEQNPDKSYSYNNAANIYYKNGNYSKYLEYKKIAARKGDENAQQDLINSGISWE